MVTSLFEYPQSATSFPLQRMNDAAPRAAANSVAYRTIRLDSNGAIVFSPPTTFHNAYFDCLPDAHAYTWHTKIRGVVKSELNNHAMHAAEATAVLVSYDDAPANIDPLQHTYVAYYIQPMSDGLHTPLPTNLRTPGGNILDAR